MRNLTLTLTLACLTTLTACEESSEDSSDEPNSIEDNDPEENYTAARFALDGDVPPSTLTLTHADLSGEDFVFGSVIASSEVEGATVDLRLPDPQASDLMPVEGAAGLNGAWYIAALNAGEAYVGVSMYYLVFLEGELTQDYADAGMDLGWNALELDARGMPLPIDLMDVPMNTSIQTQDTLTVSGEIRGGNEMSIPGVVLIPGSFFEGVVPDKYLYDATFRDSFSITLQGPPPSAHGDSDGTHEYPFVYDDKDRSGSLTGGDTTYSMVCTPDGTPAMLSYLPPITDLMTAFIYAEAEYSAGWNAFNMPYGSLPARPVLGAARDNLQIYSGCQMPG